MSWFDRAGRRMPKATGALLALSFLALASGCQVRPLYSTDADAAGALQSIQFSEAEDRVGLEVRNNLVFMAGRGAGEPVNPEYDVDLIVTTRNIGVLLELSSDTPRAGRIEVKADFVLKKHTTGEVLKTGKRRAVALVDFPAQEFARIRATRDAENRAARELAELIRTDLAGWLGR